MDLLSVKEIRVGARSSPLSRAQVEEVSALLKPHHPDVRFIPLWFQVTGDLDQKTSLLFMEKTDFFTKEIDEAVLDGRCDIGIHSAKDLPEPLKKGLRVIAYTQGVDPSDVLILKEGIHLDELPLEAKIGTSSLRRERNLKAIRPDLVCVDIRGTIENRLALLDQGKVDGVVLAQAALLRLRISRQGIFLPGEVAPMQGRLAIVAREEDEAMFRLFSCLDAGEQKPL